MPFPSGIRARLLLRSFLVQGSWNYHTLIGTGFAFMLLPALRYIYRGNDERLQAAVARHSTVFNSHPYLAGIAAGAVARLEAEAADPALIGRFKDALRSSLGALGDQLVWATWKPAVALLAIALLLVGAPWWISVLVFLIVYNAFHLWLRVWALLVGLQAGSSVGKALRDAPLQLWARRFGDAGAAIAGFSVTLAVGNAAPDPLVLLGCIAAALAGVALGLRARPVIWAVLALALVVGAVLGALRGPIR